MRKALLLTLAAVSLAATPRWTACQSAEQAAVLTAVRGFHDALTRGDSAAAVAFLSADVRILESGGVETLDEYRRGHLPADINFARAVPSTSGEPTVTVSGDVAWVVTTSRTTGAYRDRQINSAGAELVVLSRMREGWRIRAIHWSSRPIRTP